MTHKFDVNNRRQLESEERRSLLTPYETLKTLGYQKGDTIADIGCGIGLFTIPAAEIGGDEAKIYAVDVSEEMLCEVKKRAEKAGFNNITIVKSDEYDFKLLNETMDFVLICAVLHEIDDKKRFLQEASRICRKGGKIAIIDFNETQTTYGPPLSHRIARKQVLTLVSETGFYNAYDTDISESFYTVKALKA